MRPVRLVPVGGADRLLLDAISARVGRELGTTCSRDDRALDVTFAHHQERNQYHSTQILERLPHLEREIVLGVADVDLYIPILTFVFGEAQMGGTRAVVSYHRLHQEFYGLPGDRKLLIQRLAKEAIHEIGHTLGLTHCDDYDCVMAASHAVEWLDQKSTSLCGECWARADVGTLV